MAETLHATARGLEYSARSQAEFSERMAVAIGMLCSPWQSPERAARRKERR